MKLLITNFKFESESFDMMLPTVYSDYGELSAPYVRTYAIECFNFSYDKKQLSNIHSYTTENNSIQPMIRDIVDVTKEQNVYDDYVSVRVTPLVKSSFVIYVSDDMLEFANGDLQLAIDICIENQLVIDFLIEYTNSHLH